VFERSSATGRLVCAFNLGRAPHTLQPPPGGWRLVESVGGAGTWTLPGLSGLIAERI